MAQATIDPATTHGLHVPLFQNVLRIMLVAEKSGQDGKSKRAFVLTFLLSARIIEEADLPQVEGIIDLIIWSAHNFKDLAALTTKAGCSPFCRKLK
jgi:hypothetical protein